MNAHAAAIQLQGLKKLHGSFVAVSNIDLVIRAGEFFSLLGPSGCGKTTTLRMIGGFEVPTGGRILLNDADIAHLPPERRPINMVFQSYALFPTMTVYDNIAFGLRSTGVGGVQLKNRVSEMLGITKLEQFASRRPGQLSGGQQQRVALARALVNRPRALLLDEPLGALDLKIRRHMQSELKRLQREFGTTFVYVTHDQEEALALSDRIAVMHEGKIAQCGTPEEIYSRPSSRVVAEFVGETNAFEGTALVENGKLALLSSGDRRLSLRSPREAAGASGARIVALVRPENVLLGDDGTAATLRGQVVSVMYLGSQAKLEIVTEPGFTFDCLTRSVDAGVGIGETVCLHWRPEHELLFPT
ncbi:ABC transporter ATP-binding protein [Mesorhizobium sp. M3A.F.Ca.ET.201.01.1.1]|uniref:ABC transporter ATP-binding protein n=1 Tax=Mesorhizobium sp. M3A.F.Ca.ET.201.01.1.1 TaxID=2563946 RepID=UPI001093C62C|nr:ABC transporter ATP-binding protein [Mesorhizobium sp. M3A.F.Ca.ET.201.01.1.1]TGS71740.1 ABC transporter ATP-binding protein [Mesorhizobium sp. M3A.F.Ca.ET.201.01.1.1]